MSPVGLVPDLWRIRPLNRVAEVSYGISTPLNRSLKEGIPIIAMPNVTKDGRLVLEGIPFVEPHRVKERDILEPGDILFNWRSGSKDHLGKTAYFALEGTYTHVGFLLRIRCKTGIDRFYLNLYLKLIKMRGFFLRAKSQVNNTFNKEELNALPVVVPPIDEQNALSTLLQTWDNAIGHLQQLIDARMRLKRGLTNQLLTGKRRLENCKHAKWKRYRLGDIFKERKETRRTDLPLLSITSSGGVVSRDELNRKDTSNLDKSKYKRIAGGDIGYNTMRMWQGVSALSTLEGIVSPAYTVLIPQPPISGRFAAHLFKSSSVINLFYRYSQGLVDDTRNLKYHHFALIRVSIPEYAEQERIAKILDEMDHSIKHATEYRDRLITQKRGLMLVLLTGSVRIGIGSDRESSK